MKICPYCNQQKPAQGFYNHQLACQRRPSNNKLREMYVNLKSIKEVARGLGMPNGHNVVKRWLVEAGVKTRTNNKVSRKIKVQARRDFVYNPVGGCDNCPVEICAECEVNANAGRPVKCEGPLVSGQIVELSYWQQQGWWPSET